MWILTTIIYLLDRNYQDEDGFILNDDGKKSATIHQYNRCWDQMVNLVGSEKTLDQATN
jgi:hypothetical protein